MQIAEIIETISMMGIGNDIPYDNLTEADKRIFLRYLNLAHFELYRETAAINKYVIERNFQLTSSDDPSIIDLPFKPFSLLSVVIGFTKGNKYSYLSQITQEQLFSYVYHDKNKVEVPLYYDFNRGGRITLYPKLTNQILVAIIYVKQPESFTLVTRERDIPYPIAFHSILIDGALYYLFQDEGGFHNTTRMSESSARWKKNKADFVSYLCNNADLTSNISTFSNV